MHLDGLGDIAQHQGYKVLHSLGEKGALLLDQLAGDFEDSGGALMQGLDQPVRRLELLGDILLFLFRSRLAADMGIVVVVDQHFGQRIRIQFDDPTAARCRAH